MVRKKLVPSGTISDKVDEVELKPWEEVRGALSSVLEKDDSLEFVLTARPVLVEVRVPSEILVGRVPRVGSEISLLRTDKDYRVKTLFRSSARALNPT